ncbi:protein of unknown function [Candidatus Filomicrobium marinum]|uniref:Uncharacterized protein n=1 Tax=Candidatus Filomicrobium marinum TaxID=1608628 RepID=A0A0D6JLF3_9HYPH|nr:protein of unknown function [Candidatus Filomicrobium marinum]CPR22507.1 protein of unknown function [Candidatus Filomicrobium marinum]
MIKDGAITEAHHKIPYPDDWIHALGSHID